MTAEPLPQQQPRVRSPRRRVIRAALRDAIALHRNYTGNQDAVAVYEHIARELDDGTPPLAAELGQLPGLDVLRRPRLPVLCTDGMCDKVLAGVQCAACGKAFAALGFSGGTEPPPVVLGLTPGGLEILICGIHDPADVVEPVP